jgi:diaminohydroxyphosphoribosylaminopyrimidine deaminase/5-amino-6-(5-phosphoribosylamino)uracil reductase
MDPFIKVRGSGIAKMRDKGINVEINILEEENNLLNKRFFTYHRKERPYILLKWAQSKDGFIAPKKQEGKFWMTSKESKELVHKWRSQEDGILVGRITAEKDNPQLTNRLFVGKNPIRLIIDKNLSIEKTFNVFNNDSKTIIFNNIINNLESSNHFIKINFDNMLNEILAILYSKNIQSIIVEGGTKTLQSFINNNLWDEARIFKTKNKINEGVKSPSINGKIISTSIINNDTLNILVNE